MMRAPFSPPSTSPDLLYSSFNHSGSCVSVGLTDGYRIYSCASSSSALLHSSRMNGIGICEMLFCTSLVALVGGGDRPAFSPRQMRLVDAMKDEVIFEVSFVTAVVGIRLNLQRLVAVLTSAVHIFDINTGVCLHKIETSCNREGIVALSTGEKCDSPMYLAFPGDVGEVLLYDATTVKILNKISACQSSVTALSFNADGSLLAAASERGTIIRVFTIPTSYQVFALRRGSRPSCIYSLAFNPDSTKIAVSGSSGTVHVFYLDIPREEPTKVLEGGSEFDLGKKVLSLLSNATKKSSNGLMPKWVSDTVNCDRSFAHAHLWRPGEKPNVEWLWNKNICCLVPCEEEESKDYGCSECLVVLRSDGLLLRFVVGSTVGDSKCRLVSANSLMHM